MRLRRPTWQQKLQNKLYQEINFVPKRLVLLTFLLLAFYALLAIRTELRQTGRPGLIEVRLKSKLTADYESMANQALAFAPLSFAVVEAKIRDKNPYLSEAEVTTLVQTAIAAAHVPIITATPTPGLIGNAVIRSVRIVTQNVVTAMPLSTAVALRITEQMTDTAMIASPAATFASTLVPATVSLQNQAGNRELAVGGDPIVMSGSTPTLTVLPKTPSLQQEIRVTVPDTPTVLPVTPENPLHPATETPIATVATEIPHETATQQIPAPEVTTTTPPPTVPTGTMPPTATATPTLAASIGLSASLASTATAWPSATASSTPSPTRMTPTLTNTPLSLPTAIVTPTATPTVGAPPPILDLTVYVKADQVYLTWSPSFAAGVVGYNLYRSLSELVTEGQLVNAQPIAGSAYVDTVVMDGSQTFYVVRAVNQFNQESPPSEAVIAKLPDRIPPQTPLNFSVRLTGANVQIQWQASSVPDLAGYHVYRSTHLPIDRTQGSLNGATPLLSPTYQDTILLNGATYYYVFTAVDLSGNESFPSIEAQIPTIDGEAPAPPTGLTVSLSDSAALIQWQANSEPDIAGYRLYRSHTLPIDTSTPLHAESLLTALQYRDDNLLRNEPYYYLLVAVDISQNTSKPSDPVALMGPNKVRAYATISAATCGARHKPVHQRASG